MIGLKLRNDGLQALMKDQSIYVAFDALQGQYIRA